MIFEKLAKFVVKRPVLIVLVWAVVLFYAMPLILSVDDVIAYQETEFVGEESESQMAANLIKEQFPTNYTGSSMLLAVLDDDLTTPDNRDMILEMCDTLRTAEDIKYLAEVLTIYDVYAEAFEETASSLAPAMHMMEDEATLALQLLYGVPEGYFMAFEGVNGTAYIVYGIPAMYLDVWVQTYTDFGDPMLADVTAYWAVRDYVDVEANLDPANATLVTSYYYIFSETWNASAMISPPDARAQFSLTTAVQSLAASPAIPAEYAMMLLAVHENLTLVDFANPLNQSDVAYLLTLDNMQSWIPDPEQLLMAAGLLDATHGVWKASFITSPDLSVSDRSALVLPQAHQAFIDQAGFPEDSEEYLLFVTLTDRFGPSNYTDPAIIHNVTLDVIDEQANIGNLSFLQTVYDLGPDPSEENITEFAWDIVLNGSIATYPIQLPEGVRQSFVSDDNGTMLVIVSFTRDSTFREADGSEPIVDNVEIIRLAVRSIESTNDGLRIYVTGDAPITADMSKMTDEDLMLIEPITIAMVLILMGVFFRSVLGPVVPLGAIGIALGLSQAVIVLIGTYVADVHFTVLTLVVTILFGVGTDYSIFILARYREERLKGKDGPRAMETSITWAGESISTSGATVIISFGVISISSFAMLRTMGLVIGIAVLIALLVSLTLVPSIALLLGRKVFWPVSGKRWENYRMSYLKRRAQKRGGYFRNAARLAVKHAIPIFVIALVISVPTTYLFMTGETSYDFIAGMGDNESVQGLNAIEESFGAGRISPTEIVIQFDSPVLLDNDTFDISYLNTIENVSATAFSTNDNVHEVISPTRPNGDLINYTNLSAISEPDRSGLIFQMKSMIGLDNRTVLIQAILIEEPLTSLSLDTVEKIREDITVLKIVDPNLASATILIGGTTAAMLDVDSILSVEFGQMEILVIIGVFIVLFVVLGSVMLPLFAILSIGLSISWTLAATLFVFDIVLGKPILWMLPVVLFVVLMGLGMDYNIFILTRVREEAQRRGDHIRAVIEAVDRTGGIITACAAIMAGAFGSMMISGTAILQEMGFALAFAVLLDAMLVRTYLTPAIMKILGPKWTWWAPGRLQRVNTDDLVAEYDIDLDEDI